MSEAIMMEKPATLSRDDLRQDFLDQSPWSTWNVEALKADASFRCYFRLTSGNSSVLLMDAPPATEDLDAYIRIASYLSECGLRAPRVLAQDLNHGFAVIEDFGFNTYTVLLDKGVPAEPLYTLAVDSLIQLHKAYGKTNIDVPRYDAGFYDDEAALFVDWYMPARLGRKLSTSERDDFLARFASLINSVNTKDECLVLRDYHVDNLMLVDGAEGVNACGQLDFQDALIGSRSYDLVSLLEDARRDVCPEMTERLLEHYLAEMPSTDRASFLRDYRVLSAHRHAKVIGIFVRLCVRDNKAHYLSYLPHVQQLFERSLQSPHLAPIAQWITAHHPDAITKPLVFDAQALRELLV
ncbi:aminoglycoside phosphotransferase family protein [Umboniibacter marinipuniceus]|uniref:Aminoglycoside phosphotransferase domain-containing protein n=1 Tax=Umboniibacter marinipuniceus TaxID=569599 RepID=A0A3M0A569_9GAMM|nr:phosphotransferase [Umboniibacter marinipuniceus]RMA77615.1 hypothetical protein DFR27_2434 [Umboniibacter marinipuniceus]